MLPTRSIFSHFTAVVPPVWVPLSVPVAPTVGAELRLDLPIGAHRDEGERGAGVQRVPEHHAALGPLVGVLDAVHPGHDGRVAGDLLIDEVELVHRVAEGAVDVVAAAVDGEDAARLASCCPPPPTAPMSRLLQGPHTPQSAGQVEQVSPPPQVALPQVSLPPPRPLGVSPLAVRYSLSSETPFSRLAISIVCVPAVRV